MRPTSLLPRTFLLIVLSATVLAAPAHAGHTEVWFAPNVASVDMLDLFTSPEQWADARAKIDVFKFYSGHVGTGGWSCDINPSAVCGTNHIQNFIDVQAFAKLGQWGIDIALESFFAGPVMAADPITCSTVEHIYNLSLSGSVNIIQSVEANGGVVRCLAMDEPIRQWLPAYYYLRTGQTDPRPCLVDSLDILADHMAAYLLQMEAWFPSVEIGHIDLYPEVSVDMFKEWILALEARGVSISFLHLDVNKPRIDQYNSFGFGIDPAADFAELKSFLEPRGIELGIIYIDWYWNSQLWEPGSYDDQTYYDGAMSMVQEVATMGVDFDHSIIQSWAKPYFTTYTGPNEVPVNLPDDDPSIYSHTRLVCDATPLVVSVPEESPADVPRFSALQQNHPNPFGAQTSIAYEIDEPSHVTLTVYDVRGREVRTLVDSLQGPGPHTIDFEARGLTAGVYFYTLQAGDRFITTKKMLLLK